jgi:hypothetical protein
MRCGASATVFVMIDAFLWKNHIGLLDFVCVFCRYFIVFYAMMPVCRFWNGKVLQPLFLSIQYAFLTFNGRLAAMTQYRNFSILWEMKRALGCILLFARVWRILNHICKFLLNCEIGLFRAYSQSKEFRKFSDFCVKTCRSVEYMLNLGMRR